MQHLYIHLYKNKDSYNFTVIFIFSMFILYSWYFVFSHDSCYSFVNNFMFFLFKMNFTSLRPFLSIFMQCNPAAFFMESLPLYIWFIISTSLNNNIVDIQKLYGIFPPTFDVNNFSGLFWHSSVFYQRIKICINNKWCFIRFVTLIKP